MAKTTKYANVLVKISVQRSTLLREEKLKLLSESKNLPDLAGLLRDTTYQEKIMHLTMPLNSRKLERAFNESYIEACIKTVNNAPKTVAPFLEAYIQRFEVENIKALIKTVSSEKSPEERIARIYLTIEDFFDNRALFEGAAKATNLKQLVDDLKETAYASALTVGLNKYNELGTIALFDVLLDKFYFEKLYEAYQGLPKNEKTHAVFYVSIEYDSFILLTLLRGKALGYDEHWLRVAIPNGSFNLSKDTIDALVTADDFGSAFNIAQKSYYGRFFAKATLPEVTLAGAEKAFRKARFDHAVASRVTETFNVGALLAYLTQKEAETYNLIAISVGIETATEPEDIQRALLLAV